MNLIEMYNICSFELVDFCDISGYCYPRLYSGGDVHCISDYLTDPSDFDKLHFSIISDYR